jgi:hypothetical protein
MPVWAGVSVQGRQTNSIPLCWIRVVWVAVTVGGVAASSVWGLGLHCEARIRDGEFPCFGPVDPNGVELEAFVRPELRRGPQ